MISCLWLGLKIPDSSKSCLISPAQVPEGNTDVAGNAPGRIVLFLWGFSPKPNVVSWWAGPDQAEEHFFSGHKQVQSLKPKGSSSLLVSFLEDHTSTQLRRKNYPRENSKKWRGSETLIQKVGWEGHAFLIEWCPDPSCLITHWEDQDSHELSPGQYFPNHSFTEK